MNRKRNPRPVAKNGKEMKTTCPAVVRQISSRYSGFWGLLFAHSSRRFFILRLIAVISNSFPPGFESSCFSAFRSSSYIPAKSVSREDQLEDSESLHFPSSLTSIFLPRYCPRVSSICFVHRSIIVSHWSITACISGAINFIPSSFPEAKSGRVEMADFLTSS